MNDLFVIEAIVGIGTLGGLLLTAASPVVPRLLAKFRKPMSLICPQDGKPTEVFIDASHAATTSGHKLRLQRCSRWPEEGACDRGCISQLTR